jgi:hypothetical protein
MISLLLGLCLVGPADPVYESILFYTPATLPSFRRKVLDALEGISSDEEASSSAEEDDKEEEIPASKKAKPDVTIDDLEKAGYTSGPSVLYMKAPQEEQQCDWAWYVNRGHSTGH